MVNLKESVSVCYSYYAGERQTLFNLVEHYIPYFPKLNKRKQFEILLSGISPENPEFHTTNTKLSIAVQKFILKSTRTKLRSCEAIDI